MRARTVYRYLSGRLLDGTAGGWLTPGSGSWWRRRPGWQRQTVRIWLPVAYLWGEAAAHPAIAEGSVLAVAAVAGPYALRRGYRWWRMRRFHATYTRPTLAALRLALGDAPIRLHVDPGLGSLMLRLAKPMSPFEEQVRGWYGRHIEPVMRWLPDRLQLAAWAVQRAARPLTRHVAHFRRPVNDPGQRIELTAAVPFLTGEQQQMVAAIIAAKLPAGELVGSVDQVGEHVTATWKVRKRPPSHCGYADLDARFAQLKHSEFFLGLGADTRKVVADLHTDSPHVAISAGSGAGKSVLAQLIAVQVLARGGNVTILDIKGSHKWALGMPGVDYCHTPEQMHHALLRISAMADERNQASLYEADDWVPGPRHLVIAEELNVTMARIRDWWEANRPKGSPKIPPAVAGFRSVSAMGRSALANAIAIAQMLSAIASGGPEARENFGIRCLARFTANNWKMLCPNTPMPRASRTLGRWQVVMGDVASETQVCFLTTDQARLFVHKYRSVPASPVSPGSPLEGADQEMSPGHGLDPAAAGTAGDPRDAQMTLREACERRWVPWSPEAAKKRLQRARTAERDTVPPVTGKRGQADLYRAGDLAAWVESEMVP